MTRLCALLLLLAGPVAAQNVLSNPGFELPLADGMPPRWQNNTWGECQTAFSLDRTRPHDGLAALRVGCVKRVNGASQFYQPLALQAGKRYRVSLWVRAEGNVPSVGASLRLIPEPYRRHGGAEVEPGRDWERLQFEAVPLADEPQAGLFIWFQAEDRGTVWVDEVSVEVGDAAPPAGPAPTGNVLPNGSFEVNPARTWDCVGGTLLWPDAQFVAHGQRSLHLRLAAGESFRLRTPCLDFHGNGEAFSLALAARAQGPVSVAADVRSALQVKTAGSLLHLAAKPDAKLQRFSVRGPLASSLNGSYFVELSGRAEQAGDLWLDAVSLARESEVFQPAAPLEMALSTELPGAIFAPAATVPLRLEVCNAGPAFRGEAHVTVRDFAENLVCATRVPLALAGGALASQTVALPVKRLGAFRAEVRLDDAAPPCASLVFSVIPQPRPVPAAQSVVGGHFATTSDWQLGIAQRLGYHWTRIHDCSAITHWRSSEPQPGQWRFFDDEVKRVRAAGLEILGEFLRVPDWATTASPGTADYQIGVGPFRAQDAFANYVRTVVGHYRRDIHYWEIWNEPYGHGFWGGTPEEYGTLALTAARAAREADPTCKLLAPCTFPTATEWTHRALAAGAIQQADIFSYHGYECFAKSRYEQVNAWARRDGQLLPRWNTETGVTARTFYRYQSDKLVDAYTQWLGGSSVEDAVSASVKLFVLALAGGADRYFYYWTNVEAGMCPRLTSMSIYEYDRTIRPHGVAYALAASLLDPCGGAGIMEADRATVALLKREGENVAVLWARTRLGEGDLTLTGLPAGTQVLDVMANPLTQEQGGQLTFPLRKQPAYVIAPGRSLAALRRSLEGALGQR